MIATIAANEHRHVCTIDIGGAYLNAKMTSDIYMYLDVELSRCMCNLFPEYLNYLDNNNKILVKLDKALYGCIESAKL